MGDGLIGASNDVIERFQDGESGCPMGFVKEWKGVVSSCSGERLVRFLVVGPIGNLLP